MKKIILIITIILFLSGCSGNINYDFNENEIDSTIETQFTLDEYFHQYYDHDNKIEKPTDNELLIDLSEKKSMLSIKAFINDEQSEYKQTKYSKLNDKDYLLEYNFKYNYNNIKDNYIFNKCFEFFNTYEDENYYYYSLSGKFLCEYDNINLNITSKNGVGINNADKLKDNIYTWNIKEENDISFAISKQLIETKNTSSIRIIGLIVIILLSLITFAIIFLNKKGIFKN